MFILDTNVVSEFYRIADGKADANVVAWVSANSTLQFYMSAITLFEIEVGILRSERRDPVKGARLRQWMNNRIIPEFNQRILPIDVTIAVRAAALHVPETRPDNDAWIAATALVHDMIVVTHNTADFATTGVRLLNPWHPIP
jgi:predicted nucleic acid-binding protein